MAELQKTGAFLSYMGAGLAPSSPRQEETRPVRVDNTQLIRDAQHGSADAFEDLVRQYDRAVLRLAVHLTGSPEDGQDIYQEAFLRAGWSRAGGPQSVLLPRRLRS